MKLRSFMAISIASLMAASVWAQCPYEKTQSVPASVQIHGAQSCGGFSYNIGGVQIGGQQDGCPLFVIYTPPYEIAVSTNLETKVVPTGAAAPITMATFICVTRWAFIIPIGSRCSLDKTVNLGTAQRLVTAPC